MGCEAREDAHYDPATAPQYKYPPEGSGRGNRDGAEAGGGAVGCVVRRRELGLRPVFIAGSLPGRSDEGPRRVDLRPETSEALLPGFVGV